MQERWEGYGKNWMHFVYKTDSLFQSIRISYGKSPVTIGFQFLNLFELLTFCVFKMHHSKPHHQFSTLSWLHLLFFMHLMVYFELNDPEIENHYKWTLKRLKVGMVSSFHAHSMCKKVERVTAKTGCTSCTKWTISFEVSGFGRKLVCYKGISFF